MVPVVDDGDKRETPGNAPPARLPVAFVSHGAPLLARDLVKGGELAAWARAMPRPRAVLVLSAHWITSPPSIGATATLPLIYDFFGFPDELFTLTYPSPGAPDLADRVADVLASPYAPSRNAGRGLDHGAWVPLLHMYPAADVPVLQVGWPGRASTADLFALGRAIAPLRAEGVLILASGGFVHNLGRIDWTDRAAAPTWAHEFDGWAADVLARRDFDALIDFRTRAPALAMAHPTDEHFLPLLIAAGAASDGPSEVTFPVHGFEFGSLSRRCVQFG